MFPSDISKDLDGGILIHLQYLGEQHTLTLVQILVMFRSHLKQTAEKSFRNTCSRQTYFTNTGPSYAAFVNIGHLDTQAAVVLFEPGTRAVLSHASDSNLGSRDFDEALFCHFEAVFKQQYNVDVSARQRACIWVRAACEKLKKVLSANPEAPHNTECLMEDKDVKGFITGNEFKSLAETI